MIFHGFQKLTLLDFPGKVACTVFTAGCQLRCPFCHNASLVTHIDNQNVWDEQEVLDYLQKRKGLIDGICVTGGEPLMQEGLESFLQNVKALGFAVKLDTNGGFPDRLQALTEKGLIDHVAVDIKNVPEKYPQTVGVPSLDITPILNSVAYLLQGHVSYEFRTTVVSEYHSVSDIEAIAQWIKGASAYYLQQFADSGDLIASGMSAVSEETLHRMCDAATPFVSFCGIRGI